MAVRYSEIKNMNIPEAFVKIKENISPRVIKKMTIEDFWRETGNAFHGIYFMFENKTHNPLYIGKTASLDLLNRVIQHIRWDFRHDARFKNTSGAEDMANAHVSFLIADNERDYKPAINKLECWFIAYAKPKYNKTYKNWKCDTIKIISDFLQT